MLVHWARQSVTERNSAPLRLRFLYSAISAIGELATALTRCKLGRQGEGTMDTMQRGAIARSLVAAGAFAVTLTLGLPLGAALAAEPTYVMKITTPTINDVPDTYARNFAAAVEKDSGGRIKGEVYPASQLGPIPRQIEGTQFGAIQMAVIPSEFWVGVDERFQITAAPGLVDSLAH